MNSTIQVKSQLILIIIPTSDFEFGPFEHDIGKCTYHFPKPESIIANHQRHITYNQNKVPKVKFAAGLMDPTFNLGRDQKIPSFFLP